MSLCQGCLHGFIKERESLNVREHYSYYGSGTAERSNGKFLQCLSNTHVDYVPPSRIYLHTTLLFIYLISNL